MLDQPIMYQPAAIFTAPIFDRVACLCGMHGYMHIADEGDEILERQLLGIWLSKVTGNARKSRMRGVLLCDMRND